MMVNSTQFNNKDCVRCPPPLSGLGTGTGTVQAVAEL